MEIIPLGDHYVWYCEWCDSRNLTLWTKFEKEKVQCGACQIPFPVPQDSNAESRSGFL